MSEEQPKETPTETAVSSYAVVLQSDTYSGSSEKPYNTGSQTRLYSSTDQSDGEARKVSIDDFLDTKPFAGMSVGDKVEGRGNVFVTNVTYTQVGAFAISEAIQYNGTNPFNKDWGASLTQTVEPKAAGYINADVRASSTSATWWRYADPTSFFSGATSERFPWEGQIISKTFQCELERNTDIACDIAGVPMTVPLPQVELVITTTWAPTDQLSLYRSRWAEIRNVRNLTTFLGYQKGTLLFAGASTRYAGPDSMPVSDLRFIYDPYGWCRQRAISAPGGLFSESYLIGLEPPSTGVSACADTGDDKKPEFQHAKYVYWTQLFQRMSDFNVGPSGSVGLFTPEQLAELTGMLT
jgi:hypothetical protein